MNALIVPFGNFLNLCYVILTIVLAVLSEMNWRKKLSLHLHSYIHWHIATCLILLSYCVSNVLIIVSLKANTSSTSPIGFQMPCWTWRSHKNYRYDVKSKDAFCSDKLYVGYMIFCWSMLTETKYEFDNKNIKVTEGL